MTTTPALRVLQQALQRHLLGDDRAVVDAVVDAPPLPAIERLAIYRTGYRVRLIDALRDTYPVLHAILGDEMFTQLGQSFVDAHPSVYRSIRWYGRELEQTLTTLSPYAATPILAEMARFEWTLSEVFDAADAEPLPRSALSAVRPDEWSELAFEFHPSVRRLEFRWNTVAAWQALSRGEVPPEPSASARPVPWLLWRQGLQNYFRSLTEAETAALAAAVEGGTFGEICSALAKTVPEEEIPLHAATLLGAWSDSGIITAIA